MYHLIEKGNNLEEKVKILIVDDDKSSQVTLKLIFERKDFEVKTVESGKAALDEVKRKFYNIILLDIKLPDLMGTDLIKIIKKENSDIEIIIVTAFASTDTAIQALNDGASAYITKPLNLEEVFVIFSKVIEKQNLKFEKRKSELALKKSENRFRSLFENMLEGFALCKICVDDNDEPVDFLYLEINDAFEKLTGLKRAETIGKKVTEVIPGIKGVEPNLIEIYGKVASTGEETKLEFFFEPLNIWLKITVYSPEKGYFVAVFDNITKRKVAEQELKESENMFRTIAEQSFIGILIIQDGVFKYVNESMSRITEYNVKELIDLTPTELFTFIHPDDIDDAKANLKKLLEGINEIPPYRSYRIITKSGELKWLNAYSKIIKYKNENAILSVVLDVSDLKEAEKIIQEEVEKLRELDQIKIDLIRRVSHELKTPLTSIYSTSILLLNVYEKEFSKKALDYIRIIKSGGERLKELVNNLIDVYDIESNNLKLEFFPGNLCEIIEKCVNELKPILSDRQHEIYIDLPKIVFVGLDYDRIKQVIKNILANAIKYTPPKGKISIQLKDFNNYAEITIKDTGIGFNEQEKEKLFKRFGKIERYGKGMFVDTEGAGLGLFLSKEIVHLHRGEISLKSEGRNKGSSFTIRLYKNENKN